GPAVAQDTGGHVHSARKGLVIGEKAGQQGRSRDFAIRLDLVQLGAVDDLDVRPTAGASARDDVGEAIGVDVGGRYGNSAPEGGIIGVEAGHQGGAGDFAVGLDLVQMGAVDDLDVRPTAGAGAGDDVEMAVAVYIGKADVNAAVEGRVVGEEV